MLETEALALALTRVFALNNLAVLGIAVVMGLTLGAIPGIGGLVGMALVFPYLMDMDPYTALILMIGMRAVVNTGDALPAVLIGIPGTGSAMVTVLDGHPMALQGKAGQALGAAYTSSMLGGIIGAVLLFLLVPVVQPLVLLFGSPEFFMLGVFGISAVAGISGKSPSKGFTMACVGVLLGMVGTSRQGFVFRWTFDQMYFWDGISISLLALGLFGIAEIVHVAATSKTIAREGKLTGSPLEGCLAVFRHWPALLRGSIIGVIGGIIPGVGSNPSCWFAYSQTVYSDKNPSPPYGQGNIKGVIAPEAANNSGDGGELVPTIAFGVPGSGGHAVLLAAFLVIGVTPGIEMLKTVKGLSLTYTMVYTLVLGNILGAAIMLAGSRLFAKISILEMRYVVPVVLSVIFVGAIQVTRDVWDIVLLCVFGIFGYLAKAFGWPRAPLLLAFVLGPIIENYYFISVRAFGIGFLLRPGVLIIAALIAVTIFLSYRRQRNEERARKSSADA